MVFAGLTNPTAVRFSPDGRVFVAEKSGLIKVFDGLADATPTVFADLRTNVYNFWDRGLLGLELHPSFPAQPYVYVLYAHDAEIGGVAPRWGTPGVTSDPCPNPPGATADGCVVSGRLSRLEAAGDVMTGSEQVLIEDWCQQYPSHSIGALDFGADGALYVTGGDGASFNFVDYGQDGNPLNPCGDPPGGVGATLTPPTAEGGALRSQDLRTSGDPVSLDGTVLRVDPATGAGLPDNPLAASADANARRIIAYGLRNPFRFVIRPGTNEVWLGDVGWNNWEEINRVVNPTDATVENFGWPCYEGNGRQAGYDSANLTVCEDLYAQAGAHTPPFFTYSHSAKVVPGESCPSGGSSIAGIAFEFYTGGPYPAAYDGALFFADYTRDCIWVIQKGANGLPDLSTLATFVAPATNPVDLQISPGGELFYADFDGGTIRRIRYPAGNRAPTAVAAANPTSGPAPLTVNFDATGSTDPELDPLTYAWDLDGDGAHDDSTAAKPSRTYQAGTVTVDLLVTDSSGATDTDSIVINAGSTPPSATIAAPSSTTTWKVGDVIAFSGSATDAEDGTLPASALSWDLILHHCPSTCHTHPIQTFAGVASGSFTTPDHEYPAHLELRLTATDSDGLTDVESVQLDPQTVTLTFQSSPAGLQLVVGSTAGTTAFTRTVIIGSRNSLSAPTPQTLAGTTYTFSSWSDGGAQTHDIIAPAVAATYTATYAAAGSSGLVAAYAFEDGIGTSVTDATGNGRTGTISGATWSTAGKFGGALSFDGTNDWVTIADHASLDLTTGMTLEAWVRPTALGTIWRTVILKEQPGELVYALYAHNGTVPEGIAFANGAERHALGSSAIPVNAWTHLAATYDGAAVRLYVNGAPAATLATAGAMPNSSGVLRIGGNAVWAEWLAGLVDEVRIYNRALSASEIQTDMNTPVGPPPDTTAPSAPGSLTATGGIGSVSLAWTASTDDVGVTRYNVHRSTVSGFTPTTANRIAQPAGTGYTDAGLAPGTYFYRVIAEDAAGNLSAPSNEASGTAAADAPPSVAVTEPADGTTVSATVTVAATASDDVGVRGVRFTLDGANLGDEDTGAPYSIQWNTATVGNGPHALRAVARDTAGQQTTSAPVTVTVDNAAATGPVAAYSFDTGSGSTVPDATGNGHTGAISGASWSNAGRYGGALSFDGTNDWVTVADAPALDLTTGMTLEAWVRPSSSPGTSWRTVVLKEQPGQLVYALYANTDTSRPSAHVFVGADLDTRGTAQLPQNAWTHLAATYDGATLRLYVNGALASSRAISGAMPASTGALRIGGNNVWPEWFRGLIDDLRIYDRALSAAEIQTDMTTRV